VVSRKHRPPKSECPTGAPEFYSSSLPNSIAVTFLARLLGTAVLFVFGGGAVFSV
jgi:hypothetical protein